MLVAAVGYWWLLVAAVGYWWLLVVVGGCWWLVVASELSIAEQNIANQF